MLVDLLLDHETIEGDRFRQIVDEYIQKRKQELVLPSAPLKEERVEKEKKEKGSL
jgi:hypothetical protein